MRSARPLLALVVLAAIAASGCISVTNIVSVKPSGSGTIELTFLVNTAMFKQLGGMMGGDAKMEGKSKVPSADDVAKEISKMKGVRLVSQTPIKQGDLEGSKVLLAFDDVNQVSVSEGMPGQGAKSGPGDDLRFSLTKQPGGTSLLSINFPDRPGEAVQGSGGATGPSKPVQKPSPEMLKMISAFFKGMRMTIAVDVDGTLVRTSSPYVEGKRVTLLDIDMEQLFSNPDALEKMGTFSLGPDTSITQVREALAKTGVTGVKINEPRVTIEMR